MQRHIVLLLPCAILAGCSRAQDLQQPAVAQQTPEAQDADCPWADWRPPDVAMPDPNALDTYRRAFELLAASRSYPAAGAKIDASRAYVQEHRQTIKLLRKALDGECRVPAREGYFDLDFWLKAHFRSAARLLAIHKARVDRADGHHLEAARDAIDGLRLGRDIATERMMVATLVEVACAAIGLNSLEQTIPHLTAAECRTAIEWLEAAEAERIPFTEVVKGEATFARRAFIRDIVNGPADLAEIEKELEVPPGSIKDLAHSWAAMDQLIDKALASAGQPYWAADPAVEVDDPLAELLFGGYTLALCRMHIARAQALSRLAMVHLAAHACWQDRGQRPDTLDALVPDYLTEVPVDPFSGEPLRSSMKDGQFVIYSVGPDRTDDGGRKVEIPGGEESKGDLAQTVEPPVAQ